MLDFIEWLNNQGIKDIGLIESLDRSVKCLPYSALASGEQKSTVRTCSHRTLRSCMHTQQGGIWCIRHLNPLLQ